MEQSNPILILDAKLYLCVLKLLVSCEDFEIIDSQFRKLRSVINQSEMTYCKVHNILSLLLLYTTPSSISIANIQKLSANIQGLDEVGNLHSVSLEEFVRDMEIKYDPGIKKELAIFTTADGILLQTKLLGKKVGFVGEDISVGEELNFLFVKSKSIQLSKYNNDLKVLYPLFNSLGDFPLFQEWYRGYVSPYVFYWDNFGSLVDVFTSFNELEYLPYEEKFDKLIYPLEYTRGPKLLVQAWITNVIIPLVRQNGNNFTPLLKWLVKFESTSPIKYDVWYQCFQAIVTDSSIKFESYKLLIKYYLGSCYYFTIFYDNLDNLNSIEIMKIYGKIKDTLNIISKKIDGNLEIPNIQIKKTEQYENIEEFINDKTNPLTILFEPNNSSVIYFKKLIDTCEKLHPINKLTVSDYLDYKYIKDSDGKKAEVSKILSNLDENNWRQLFSSANIFIETFTSQGIDESINKLIIERFLMFGLFEVVIELIDLKKLSLDANEFYKITEFKFWTSFNQASNLNESLGKLREASLCIKLFDRISIHNDLSQENKEKIIEIKHLLKALSNMKNFKLVIEKNTPCTPKQVLNKIKSIPTDREQLDNLSPPLNLISLILEQNPKSYIAFEKLYKILNDLLLYINGDNLSSSSPNLYFDKLKSLCIESALIDNNFTFAYKKSKELFEYYGNSGNKNLSSFWLTFYQVGKFISPNWFDESYDSSIDKLDVLFKQREILTLTIGLPLDSLNDNSRILLGQWETVDLQIQEYFKKSSGEVQDKLKNDSSEKVDDNANLSDIINESTHSTHRASEKLSNLFVSGLGWAIGANQ